MRIKYAIASLAVAGSLAVSASLSAEPASADSTSPVMSFNLQYLQLQSQMQHENRSYTALSNIMQAKQVTVTNLISNIR
jgi:hypothetical protein